MWGGQDGSGKFYSTAVFVLFLSIMHISWRTIDVVEGSCGKTSEEIKEDPERVSEEALDEVSEVSKRPVTR